MAEKKEKKVCKGCMNILNHVMSSFQENHVEDGGGGFGMEEILSRKYFLVFSCLIV